MSEEKRDKDRINFIKKTAWKKADVALLAGDASFRKYYRLHPTDEMLGMQSTVLMDAPPKSENVKPFVAIAERLRSLGYSAPKILSSHLLKGFLLLEDFGDHSYNSLIRETPVREHEIYSAAIDFLVDLHGRGLRNPLPVDAKKTYRVGKYNAAALLKEANLLTEWTATAVLGVDSDRDMAFESLWKKPFSMLKEEGPVLVLRDFHADNLMWIPTKVNLQRVGLLDFQDALLGHPAYDLVSLLQDARRDVPLVLEEAMIKRYLKGRERAGALVDEASFRAAYAVLGAQRNIKIVGIFTRLFMRDGKEEYLNLIPHVWKLVERNLWLEELKPLESWLNLYFPSKLRRKALSPTELSGEG